MSGVGMREEAKNGDKSWIKKLEKRKQKWFKVKKRELSNLYDYDHCILEVEWKPYICISIVYAVEVMTSLPMNR